MEMCMKFIPYKLNTFLVTTRCQFYCRRKRFEANLAHVVAVSFRGPLFQALQAATAQPVRDAIVQLLFRVP